MPAGSCEVASSIEQTARSACSLHRRSCSTMPVVSRDGCSTTPIRRAGRIRLSSRAPVAEAQPAGLIRGRCLQLDNRAPESRWCAARQRGAPGQRAVFPDPVFTPRVQTIAFRYPGQAPCSSQVPRRAIVTPTASAHSHPAARCRSAISPSAGSMASGSSGSRRPTGSPSRTCARRTTASMASRPSGTRRLVHRQLRE